MGRVDIGQKAINFIFLLGFLIVIDTHIAMTVSHIGLNLH